MKTILFALPGNEKLAKSLGSILGLQTGNAEVRHFPDGESYTRILSDVKDAKVVLVCTLNKPDQKVLSLIYMAKAAHDQGAAKVYLVAPYLAYMRQDIQFKPGEAVTSKYFASLLSNYFDKLITIDPHLHRFKSLQDIYTIQTATLHAAPFLAQWIKSNLENPLIIGPDEESLQWVSEIGEIAAAPYMVLSKTRFGEKDVKISLPDISQYPNHTLVLADDIISTAGTMIAALKHLKAKTDHKVICMGVHAVFASSAYEDLLKAGASRIITSNTIPHISNAISIDQLLADALKV